MASSKKMRMVKYIARWKIDKTFGQFYCSHCGGIAPYMPFENSKEPYQQYQTSFCPWCGATMIERKEEKVTATVYGVDHLWDCDMPEFGEEL